MLKNETTRSELSMKHNALAWFHQGSLGHSRGQGQKAANTVSSECGMEYAYLKMNIGSLSKAKNT